MNKKFKISFVDENGKEVDCITRDIPKYINYNFSKGVLVDLSLLVYRNGLKTDLFKDKEKNEEKIAPCGHLERFWKVEPDNATAWCLQCAVDELSEQLEYLRSSF